MRKSLPLIVAAIAAACGSSSAPMANRLAGHWKGTVNPTSGHVAAVVDFMLLPADNGGLDGTAVVAFGSDSLIYVDVAATVVSSSMAIVASDRFVGEPTTTFTGDVTTNLSSATGRIDGGRFENELVTLAHQP